MIQNENKTQALILDEDDELSQLHTSQNIESPQTHAPSPLKQEDTMDTADYQKRVEQEIRMF